MTIWDYGYDRKNDIFFVPHTLSNGQHCMIGFTHEGDDFKRRSDFYVCFGIANKRKSVKGFFYGTKDNDITLKSTGRSGIEALKWARDRILEFEEVLSYECERDACWLGDAVTIRVAGEDSRRFRMYERALSKYGYRKVKGEKDDYPWYMVKTIRRERKKRKRRK